MDVIFCPAFQRFENFRHIRPERLFRNADHKWSALRVSLRLCRAVRQAWKTAIKKGDDANGGGAGSGLSIVSRIMEAHGGRIESRPDPSELILGFPSPSEDRA